ncbi:MAG: S8 family serine peptidase [Okeania sp. SIO2F4]|uniref:S8 family serine peptidase n=1 Tax=Okeania sp. SIO2F4 TaxID=2607790 RepID=UPI0014291107|nr:S8 family serine peptidase [Okeania sp. SIO2F4]NES05893.1 S8 family serine peptidase [Okeania sp. SIO2F4]
MSKSMHSQEADFFYTDKSSGTELKFTPKTDEVVALIADKSMVDLETADASGKLVGINTQRRFAVLQVSKDEQQSMTDALVADPQIANSIPVMVDGDGLNRYFLPNEYTVQFNEGVSARDAEKIIEEVGSTVVYKQRTEGYYTVSVPEGVALFTAIRQMSAYSAVAFAEPSEFGLNDGLYEPNDPYFNTLWGLRNTGQTVNGKTGTAGADIKIVPAWDITRGKSSVIIAVIDTGADLDHPDLKFNILPRGVEDWDFAANDKVPEDEGSSTHGTHVAGTVAAVDNNIGVIGVAPGCQIMPLRVNLTSGMNANRADAINYVANQAATYPDRRYVINCSWKMSGNHAGVRNSIVNAVNKNVVVVFAAGNDKRNTDFTPEYPGVYPQVIAVAATDQRDKKASFSNYGNNVDVSAPGVNIRSSIGGGNYGYKNGTSMAAPHVAGLAALIWSVNPSLTNAQVRKTIEDNCDNIDSLNPTYAGKLGKGRINAYKSLLNTIPRGYAGVWRSGTGRYAVWINASWQSFRDKWQEWNAQGLRLHDIHVRRRGSKTLYSGVFLPGSGAYGLWANVTWDSFKAKWEEWSNQGLRLVDIHVHRVGNKNRYSGVFLPGSGAYGLWANVTWDSFKAKWEELSRQGLRLVDIHVHRVGNKTRYSGVFLPGRGGYGLWANTTWSSFVSKWREWSNQGLRLVDLNMHQVGNSIRYSGVFLPGNDSHYLWANVTFESLRAKWQELDEQGLRLIDFEITNPEDDATDFSDISLGGGEISYSPLEQEAFGGIFGQETVNDVVDFYQTPLEGGGGIGTGNGAKADPKVDRDLEMNGGAFFPNESENSNDQEGLGGAFFNIESADLPMTEVEGYGGVVLQD